MPEGWQLPPSMQHHHQQQQHPQAQAGEEEEDCLEGPAEELGPEQEGPVLSGGSHSTTMKTTTI